MTLVFRNRAWLALSLVGTLFAVPAQAAPPVPSGAHPRLFITPANLPQLMTNAAKSGSAAARFVAACNDTITTPRDFTARGGSDGNAWPQSAVACAFAYVTTGQAKYLTQALLYWKTSLNDDQTLGDGLGCTTASSTFNVKTWNGNEPSPPMLVTVTHDTGYPIRWYGPFIALTYDWLYNAPGVDDNLRAQTRNCLTGWIDNYTARGYLNDAPGFNYNVGYVVAKVLGAIAIGNDGGADGHLWTEAVDTLFPKLIVAKGLAGASGGVGAPAGVMVGGDWGSWQYGPLSVAEYAAAARALEEAGAPQPEMDAWVNSLIVRQIYGLLPKGDMQWNGNGDFDSESVYEGTQALQADAVLLGPSSDQAASWAMAVKQQQGPSSFPYVWNALAELRTVPAQDYRTQTPAPPLWYLARGTQTMYVRTAWDAGAFWGAFMSSPNEADHGHFAASNFVFSRGGDHLIVDPSNYGEPATMETNAITADASVMQGDYARTQADFGSSYGLPWARSATGGGFAARSDFAHAFDFNGTNSDITYAHREWVLLPEGEIVAIDRVHTSAANRNMYVNFHTNTAGTLRLDGTTFVASGTVGASSVAIHPVLLSGGTPRIVKPPVGSCTLSCSHPCGMCTASRYAVDEYSVTVPGPWAVAIHAIDGLGSSEAAAQIGSLNDDNFDPAPKQNAGVIGAAVFRATKQSYVVAASAQDGKAGTSLTYGVPGASPGRHIVFDAPEASDGTSAVAAAVTSGRCVVTVTAGSGGGLTGHPLMFQVAAAASGCTVSDGTAVAPGTPPPGGGVTPRPGTGGGSGSGSAGNGGGSNNGLGGTPGSNGTAGNGGPKRQLDPRAPVIGGCACTTSAAPGRRALALGFAMAFALVFQRRRRR